MSIVVIRDPITMVVPSSSTSTATWAADLPLITRVLIGLSSLVTHYILFLLAGIVGLIMAFRAWQRTDAGSWRSTASDPHPADCTILTNLPPAGSCARRPSWRWHPPSRRSGSPAAPSQLEFERQLIEVERKGPGGELALAGARRTGLFSDLAIEMTRWASRPEP